jgi:hypothetical protein
MLPTPEVGEWSAAEPIKEDKLAALDVVPLCIKIVSYAQPPKHIWANRTYLQLTGQTLEAFRAQVRVALCPRVAGPPGALPDRGASGVRCVGCAAREAHARRDPPQSVWPYACSGPRRVAPVTRLAALTVQARACGV